MPASGRTSARKKGQDGQYEQAAMVVRAQGRPNRRLQGQYVSTAVTSRRHSSASGFEYSKYNPTPGEDEAIPVDGFGQVQEQSQPVAEK